MSHLVDALERSYRVLGLEDAAGGDDVFRQLLLARIIEPYSKLDSLRVLEEAGVAPASYRTLKRRLPGYAQESWRQGLSEAYAAHARLDPASLVLYDVSILNFEDGQGDGFRGPLLQVTPPRAADHHRAAHRSGRVIEKFMAAHHLPDVTVVADAGMIFEANQKEIGAGGLSSSA
jgi:hypothetical protein